MLKAATKASPIFVWMLCNVVFLFNWYLIKSLPLKFTSLLSPIGDEQKVLFTEFTLGPALAYIWF